MVSDSGSAQPQTPTGPTGTPTAPTPDRSVPVDPVPDNSARTDPVPSDPVPSASARAAVAAGDAVAAGGAVAAGDAVGAGDASSQLAYYRQVSESSADGVLTASYQPTAVTEGAWASHEQHMAPASGLLAAVVERCSGRDDLITSRLSFDILGVIHRRPFDVTARVVRPGRTIELVQAEMTSQGRTLVRVNAWRLVRSDTADLAGDDFPALPGPDEGGPWTGADYWGGGFINSLELRTLPGWRPGRGRAWIRSDHPLIEGVAVSPLANLIRMTDSANGMAVRADPRELLFPNTDLTVHVFREPSGEWLGLDVSVTFGPSGIGLTSSVLHDVDGPFGTAAQSLTLRRR
ncbi:thioesterase family protein [Nakamurella aerolata]